MQLILTPASAIVIHNQHAYFTFAVLSSFQRMPRMEISGLAVKLHNLGRITQFLKAGTACGIWLIIVYHQRETKSEFRSTLETNQFFLCGVGSHESNKDFVVL